MINNFISRNLSYLSINHPWRTGNGYTWKYYPSLGLLKHSFTVWWKYQIRSSCSGLTTSKFKIILMRIMRTSKKLWWSVSSKRFNMRKCCRFSPLSNHRKSFNLEIITPCNNKISMSYFPMMFFPSVNPIFSLNNTLILIKKSKT